MPTHIDVFLAPLLTGMSLLATFWGITWKMSESMGKKISDCTDLTDKKIARIFSRFDEYKQHLESTHVRKEMCHLMHEQLTVDMAELKKDVKELLKIASGKFKD